MRETLRRIIFPGRKKSVAVNMFLALRLLMAGPMLAAASHSAIATGGLWCNADDRSVKFDVRSGMTRSRGPGSGFFNFNADLEIRAKTVPNDLRQLRMGEGNLHQNWLDRHDLKLDLFYRGSRHGHDVDVELLVETTRVDEGEYVGTYTLTVFDPRVQKNGEPLEVQGKVSCSAD
jgi:hypothetical protein